jgi:hypothetical protein
MFTTHYQGFTSLEQVTFIYLAVILNLQKGVGGVIKQRL